MTIAKIGKIVGTDAGFKIDLPTLIDTRLLICANSGAGKSYTVRKLIEESANKVLAIIIDLEGEFHTLREKYDFLLMGGTKGDIPLNLKSANLLPKSILENNVPTILDLSDFKHQDRIAFVKYFLKALMELPREYYKPCLIIIDEAHAFCGQQEKQDSVFEVIDLMTRGRKRGYCGVLCTQRISKLHKDAAAECNNYLVGRTSLDLDMKRAADILGFGSKKDAQALKDLNAGEFFAFGPAFNFKNLEKVQMARSETTHLKVGMEIKVDISPPTPKIKALLTKLTNLPREAEQSVKDRAALIQKVRELEAQLKSKPSVAIDQGMLERRWKEGYMTGIKEQAGMAQQEHSLRRELEGRLKKIAAILNLEIKVPTTTQRMSPGEMKPAARPLQTLPTRSVAKPEVQGGGSGGNSTPLSSLPSESGNLGRGERTILKFLAMRPERDFSKSQVGAITGYKPTGGSFNTYVSRLKTAGLINYSNGRLSIADSRLKEAITLLGDEYTSPENSLEDLLQLLSGGEKKIYEVLVKNPNEAYSKEDLAGQTGFVAAGGSFNTYISRLCTAGLAERIGGKIRLNSELLEV